MKSVPITDARASFGMLVNRAGLRGERILLTRNGKPIAAIVPFEDAEFMQKREDEIDIREADRIMSRGGKATPLAQVEAKRHVPDRGNRRGRKAARRTA